MACGNFICPTIGLIETKDESKVCSDRLKNWEEWRKKRNRLYYRLYRQFCRKPGELIMNYGEECRKIQEERTLFEYAKINTNFDKYRGNPEFWTLPSKLSQKGGTNDNQYFSIKTHTEQNIIPSIEYIDTPKLMLKEKRIYPLVRNIYQNWSSSKYRKQQLKVLKDKINSVKPHTPVTSSLIITGIQLLESRSKMKLNSSIPASKSNLLETFSSCFEFHKISRLSFNVYDKKTPTTSSHLTSSKIKYFFAYSDLKNPIKETLEFQNTGRTTVKITWKKVKKFSTFTNNLQEISDADSCFYFGKQEIIVRPGTTEEIPLWFLPKEHGVYMEKWTINTTPRISEEPNELIIIFQSVTDNDKQQQFADNIEELLEGGIRYTMVKDCLTDLVNDFKYKETDPKVFNVSTKQLFECRSLTETFGVLKPTYSYNNRAVMALETFYNEVKQDNDPVFEDLSLDELKIVIKRIDVINYVKIQSEQFSKSSKRRQSLNTFEKMSLIKNSKTSLKVMSSKISLKHSLPGRRQSHIAKLKSILPRFGASLMIRNHNRKKYAIAFLVLRSYFIRLCNILESSNNENDYFPNLDMKTVRRNSPEWWVIETSDDIWIPKRKRTTPTSCLFPARPKPANVLNIPHDDFQARFSAYVMPSKLPKHSKKTSKDTTEIQVQSLDKIKDTTSFFCPFDEMLVSNSEETLDMIVNRIDYSNSSKKLNYDTYILIYTTLGNAIDAMVDAMETFKQSFISEQHLKIILETRKEEYVKKRLFSAVSYGMEYSNEFFNNLLNLTLSSNENVKEYIINDKIPGKKTQPSQTLKKTYKKASSLTV